MRLTIIDTTLTKPPTGGVQTFLVDLCRGLSARGWSLTVVTEPGSDDTVVDALSALDVTVHQDIWKYHHLPEDRGNRLASWINEQCPDVYLLSMSPYIGWLALPLLDPSIATVTITHSDDFAAFYAALRHYISFVDCAVGVSQEIHRKIVSECGMPTERAIHIPYSVTTLSAEEVAARLGREEAMAERPLQIGYVGRLEQKVKRVLDLVPLASLLKQCRIPFEMQIVGDGPLRGRLATEIVRAGLADCMRLWGWLPPDEVMERLTYLDVLVLLSEYEGLSLALLEAMGQAVAPVVTHIPSGNADLVDDGVNGYLVAVGDALGFANRLETLARDRARLRRMRRAAWETSLDYTLDCMVEAYIKCFTAVSSEEFRKHSARESGPYPVMPSCRSRYANWVRKIKWALAGA